MTSETTCGNGVAHIGVNVVCIACHKPTCQSLYRGLGCTKDLFHDEDHENAFGRGKEVGPWKDPNYVPVQPTKKEIEEAIERQKSMDELVDEMVKEYHRERERFHYE